MHNNMLAGLKDVNDIEGSNTYTDGDETDLQRGGKGSLNISKNLNNKNQDSNKKDPSPNKKDNERFRTYTVYDTLSVKEKYEIERVMRLYNVQYMQYFHLLSTTSLFKNVKRKYLNKESKEVCKTVKIEMLPEFIGHLEKESSFYGFDSITDFVWKEKKLLEERKYKTLKNMKDEYQTNQEYRDCIKDKISTNNNNNNLNKEEIEDNRNMEETQKLNNLIREGEMQTYGIFEEVLMKRRKFFPNPPVFKGTEVIDISPIQNSPRSNFANPKHGSFRPYMIQNLMNASQDELRKYGKPVLPFDVPFFQPKKKVSQHVMNHVPNHVMNQIPSHTQEGLAEDSEYAFMRQRAEKNIQQRRTPEMRQDIRIDGRPDMRIDMRGQQMPQMPQMPQMQSSPPQIPRSTPYTKPPLQRNPYLVNQVNNINREYGRPAPNMQNIQNIQNINNMQNIHNFQNIQNMNIQNIQLQASEKQISNNIANQKSPSVNKQSLTMNQASNQNNVNNINNLNSKIINKLNIQDPSKMRSPIIKVPATFDYNKNKTKVMTQTKEEKKIEGVPLYDSSKRNLLTRHSDFMNRMQHVVMSKHPGSIYEERGILGGEGFRIEDLRVPRSNMHFHRIINKLYNRNYFRPTDLKEIKGNFEEWPKNLRILLRSVNDSLFHGEKEVSNLLGEWIELLEVFVERFMKDSKLLSVQNSNRNYRMNNRLGNRMSNRLRILEQGPLRIQYVVMMSGELRPMFFKGYDESISEGLVCLYKMLFKFYDVYQGMCVVFRDCFNVELDGQFSSS